MVGRTTLRATGSIRCDLKIKRMLADLSTTVLTSFFQICEGLVYPRNSQVYKTLFMAKLLRYGELQNFQNSRIVEL